MNNIKKIARKKVLYNKSQFYTLIFSITIIFSTLMTSLSLCVNYAVFFKDTAPQMLNRSLVSILYDTAQSADDLIYFIKDTLQKIEIAAQSDSGGSPPSVKESLGIIKDLIDEGQSGNSFVDSVVAVSEKAETKNAAEYPLADVPDVYLSNAKSIFSHEQGIIRFPLSFIFIVIFSVFTAFISVFSAFSGIKKDQLSFYGTLMASGAMYKHIKDCSFYESVYYLLYSLPFGTALSVVEILLIRIISPHIFDMKIHANIVPSLLAFLLSCVIVFIAIRLTSSTAYKRLSPRTLVKGIKNNYSNNIGISSFSAEAKSYRILGAEYFVAARCFSKNVISYLLIIFTLILFVLFAAFSLLTFILTSVFDVSANIPSDILSFNKSTEFFVYAICIVNALLILLDAYVSFISNIGSNMGIYTLMRSGYSPTKSVCNAVRNEGLFFSVSILSACVVLTLWAVGIADFISALSGSTILYMLLAAVLISAVFAVFILISVLIIKKRLKKLELISALKDYLY